MPVTSAQVRMARAALNWTVRDLAEAAGLHRNTINNLEVGRYAGDPKTLELIERWKEGASRRGGVQGKGGKGGSGGRDSGLVVTKQQSQ